jgi:hypothetical protein
MGSDFLGFADFDLGFDFAFDHLVFSDFCVCSLAELAGLACFWFVAFCSFGVSLVSASGFAYR